MSVLQNGFVPILVPSEPEYILPENDLDCVIKRENDGDVVPQNCWLIPELVLRNSDPANNATPTDALPVKNETTSDVLENERSAGARPSRPPKKSCKAKICETCGKELRTPKTIQRHKKYCGRKAFGCVHCPRRFSTKESAQNHEKLHTGDRPFKCPECGKAFVTKGALTTHKICTHTKGADFVCDTCGKAYVCDMYLKTHVAAMHREQRFLCEKCGKAFKTSTALRSHDDSHLGSEAVPHACDRCGKGFKTKQSLRRHMKRHDVKYDCGTCSKKFKSKKGLLLHQRNHAGEKPFGCKFCDKTFVSNENRTVHERVHTGERPYQCELCSQTFTQRHVMKTHWKKKHPDKFK